MNFWILAFLGVASASSFFNRRPQFTSPIANAIDCQYGPWTEYSQCSAPCGQQGTQARTRQIVQRAQFGGRQCDPSLLEEWKPCLEECAVDCVMSEYSQWSQCQTRDGRNCGEGNQQRTRQILVQPRNGGRQCGQLEEWRACNAGPCQENCEMGQWSSWSQCPRCGQFEQRSRFRPIVKEPRFGGLPCLSTQESEQCVIQPCGVHCVMENWSQWSACQSGNAISFNQPICGKGQRQRTRGVLVQPQFGGRQCEEREQWEACDNGPCQENCEMGQWSQWSQCPRCGEFERRNRFRPIIKEPRFGGLPCEATEESDSCNLASCSTDCVMSRWGPWSQCLPSNADENCGQGQRSRTRSILVAPQNGGKACLTPEEWEGCFLGPCQSNCEQSQWSQWSQCETRTPTGCGFGSRQRTRFITKQPSNGGIPCLPNLETEPCQGPPCPVDCVMGRWSPFSACSATCDAGVKTRTRSIITQPRNGGRPCLFTEDTQPCFEKACFRPNCIGRPTEFYVDPQEPCSGKFWKCINEETHEHVCPNGLVFNADSFKCENRQFVRACGGY